MKLPAMLLMTQAFVVREVSLFAGMNPAASSLCCSQSDAGVRTKGCFVDLVEFVPDRSEKAQLLSN